MERIREEIRVAVIFGPGKHMEPVWFDWRRRKYPVGEVTYAWRERRGEATILHFAVKSGADLFELAYNAESQLWALMGVDGQGG
ncbi:MAG TPA: hypothetical protein VF795_05680 [Desulfuromonadaceae bacterium]